MLHFHELERALFKQSIQSNTSRVKSGISKLALLRGAHQGSLSENALNFHHKFEISGLLLLSHMYVHTDTDMLTGKGHIIALRRNQPSN